MSVTHLPVDDPTVANRYLSGQLTDAEREAFENELVRNPGTLQELEATARLKVGLEWLRNSGELQRELRPSPPYRHPLVLALAATLAALAIGVVLFRGNFSSAGSPLLAATPTSFVDQRGSLLPIAGTFALFRKRVDADDAVIELPLTRQAIELRVLPQTPSQSGRYHVSLSRIHDDNSVALLASVADLTPNDDGFIEVFADASRLAPGRYRLVVRDDAESHDVATADTFLIRIVRRANK